jgi:hypothetical protein
MAYAFCLVGEWMVAAGARVWWAFQYIAYAGADW